MRSPRRLDAAARGFPGLAVGGGVARPERVPEVEVRGSAFLGPLCHVRDRLGEEGLLDVIRRSGPGAVQSFASPIRKLAYYPYAAYVEFLCGIDSALGKGDFAYGRVLGEEAGRRDLGTILRVFVAMSSPERLIRSATRVWGDYYRNAGSMTAEAWAPELTVLRVRDFPEMHPVHCRLMEGWMIAAMDVVGVSVLPGARERECTSTGGNWHEFWCQWVPKS